MNHRNYGEGPMCAVAVHGGPGAPGSVASLCRGLSSLHGTVEPFQSAMTVDGQVEELHRQINTSGDLLKDGINERAKMNIWSCRVSNRNI